GSYPADLLLEHGYVIRGLVRPSVSPNLTCLRFAEFRPKNGGAFQGAADRLQSAVLDRDSTQRTGRAAATHQRSPLALGVAKGVTSVEPVGRPSCIPPPLLRRREGRRRDQRR